MPARIHLDLLTDGAERGISAESFLRALDASLEILRDLDQAATGGTFQWRFTELGIGSGLSLVEGEPVNAVDVGPSVADELARDLEAVYFDGLASLDHHASMPPGFNRRSIEAALRLASVLSDGVSQVTTYSTQGRRVVVSERLSANAKELLGRGFTDTGSIEGRLETISLAGRPTFNVRDELSNKSVVCSLDLTRLEELKSALGHRVLVAGDLTISKRGDPSEVSPVTLVRLLGESNVPTIDELRGLEPEITEGRASGLYVRERFYAGQSV